MLHIFGIRFVGVTWENGRKLLLTVLFILGAVFIRYTLVGLVRLLTGQHRNERFTFWTRQATSLLTAILVALSVLSIWFDDPAHLATGLSLITAGLAFALQKVITALAGYFVLMRGKTFSVGDRIKMGGVRGDVIALGFIQTTIMEMGQPPGEQDDEPSMWVKGRQFTGRIVTVTNDKIFEEPIYNYTRDFPFIWEEMTIPVSFKDKRDRAEAILLEAATRATENVRQIGEAELKRLEEDYFVRKADLTPRVYWRITDNWLELSVRFLARSDEARSVKDKMSRFILKAFDEAGIGIASGTYEIVGIPPLRIEGLAAALKAARDAVDEDGAPEGAKARDGRDGVRAAREGAA